MVIYGCHCRISPVVDDIFINDLNILKNSVNNSEILKNILSNEHQESIAKDKTRKGKEHILDNSIIDYLPKYKQLILTHGH